MTSRGSLSGVQPKVFLVSDNQSIRVARYGETSTHIGKLELGLLPDLVDIEYLSLKVMSFLLPTEPVVEVSINSPPEVRDLRALIIRHFDRGMFPNRPTIHFEEFNQLLSKNCNDKYAGAYHLMADYMRSNPKCSIVDIEKLFRRILVNLIIGNTDAHFKNFGLMYSDNSSRLELCTSYDVVAEAYYKQYQSIALAVATTSDLNVSHLKYKHLKSFSESFGLSIKILDFVLQALESRFEKAIIKLEKESIVTEKLRVKFIDYLRKKWNNIKNSLGKNGVKRAVQQRKELGFTQKRLALLANVSTPTISRFENNNQDLKLSSALAIVKVLGCSIKLHIIELFLSSWHKEYTAKISY